MQIETWCLHQSPISAARFNVSLSELCSESVRSLWGSVGSQLGVCQESVRNLSGVCQESVRSLSGVRQESVKSPTGVRQGSIKSLSEFNLTLS